jgi:8-oxo-dGTP diphosphatase
VRARPMEIIATLDRIVRDDDGRVRFHYVLVEWLCMASEESPALVCGDDAQEARWVHRDEIFSEAYDLGAATLGVVERAYKLAETME